MALLIKNATVVNGDQILEKHSVLIANGMISRVEPEIELSDNAEVEVIDANGDYLVPGFIDLQINGGAGAFFTKDLTSDSIIQMAEPHLEYGTTRFLPTLISTSHDRILQAIEEVKKVQGTHGVLGMHLEGPFFNKEKKGAHFEKFIHKPEQSEIDELCEKGKDVIKLLTLAPEVVEDAHIRQLVSSGIQVSAGHSNATYKEAQNGFRQGITKVTHLFNAMSQFNSRNPGLVGAFFNSNKWGAIIADGIHVDFAAVKVAHTLAQGRLFLVSDASFVKHPIEHFEFDGFKIHYKDGHYYTEEGNLAGASIALYDAFKNCVEKLHLPLIEAVRMSSTYPAEFMGIDEKHGYLKKGYVGDAILMDKGLSIKKVIQDGQVVHTND